MLHFIFCLGLFMARMCGQEGGEGAGLSTRGAVRLRKSRKPQEVW